MKLKTSQQKVLLKGMRQSVEIMKDSAGDPKSLSGRLVTFCEAVILYLEADEHGQQ
jgi:hypothetical protein